MALFSRNKDTSAPEPEEPDVAEDEVVYVARSHTPSKGKATPKRAQAQRTRQVRKNLSPREERELRRKERSEAYEGMKAGEERYLLPRDKGPERALVRNIVDSRRNVGPYFFGSMFVLLFLLYLPDARIQLAANIFWFAMALALVVDSIVITRKIKKLVNERYPKSDQKMSSLYFYGITRAISFRKLRIPKTRVNIGDPI